MDVRIGVTYSPKELHVELPPDSKPDVVKAQVDSALGGGGASVLWFTDERGRQVGVAVDKVAYVEIGSASAERRMGFAGGS